MSEEKNKAESILHDPNIPTDTKMKLYAQEKKLDKKPHAPTKQNTLEQKHSRPPKTIPPVSEEDIISHLPSDAQPFVRSILHKMSQYQSQISYDHQMQIHIDGTPIPGSNIIEILRYLMKKMTITSDRDIPKGGLETRDKLLQIGVPQSWIRVKGRSRRLRSADPEGQVGSGLSWLTL